MYEPVTAEEMKAGFDQMMIGDFFSYMSDPDQIIYDCAIEHGIEVSDILSYSRAPRFAHPRHECMYRIRKELGYSLTAIGEIFRRHHTTVLYAVSSIEARVNENNMRTV